jgi:hypothetical protein
MLASDGAAVSTPRFVSEPIEPKSGTFDPVTISQGEPSLPTEFNWHDSVLEVGTLVRAWRSMKVDRGESYVKRHWFEFVARDGRRAVVYCERQARRGHPRWRLFTLAEP